MVTKMKYLIKCAVTFPFHSFLRLHQNQDTLDCLSLQNSNWMSNIADFTFLLKLIYMFIVYIHDYVTNCDALRHIQPII